MDAGKHSSILKPSKFSNITTYENEEEEDDSPVPTPGKQPRMSMRRVSFASSNYIKEFAADPEKLTIWNTTYEETIDKSDSTPSLQNTLCMQTEKLTLGNSDLAINLNKLAERTINFQACGGEDILLDTTLLNIDCDLDEQTEDNSNKENEGPENTILNDNMDFTKFIPFKEKTLPDTRRKTIICGQSMDLTTWHNSPTVLNPASTNKTVYEGNMELDGSSTTDISIHGTFSSDKSMELTLPIDAKIKETDNMELTTFLPNTKVLLHPQSFTEKHHVSVHDKENTYGRTPADFKKCDKQLNETRQVANKTKNTTSIIEDETSKNFKHPRIKITAQGRLNNDSKPNMNQTKFETDISTISFKKCASSTIIGGNTSSVSKDQSVDDTNKLHTTLNTSRKRPSSTAINRESKQLLLESKSHQLIDGDTVLKPNTLNLQQQSLSKQIEREEVCCATVNSLKTVELNETTKTVNNRGVSASQTQKIDENMTHNKTGASFDVFGKTQLEGFNESNVAAQKFETDNVTSSNIMYYKSILNQTSLHLDDVVDTSVGQSHISDTIGYSEQSCAVPNDASLVATNFANEGSFNQTLSNFQVDVDPLANTTLATRPTAEKRKNSSCVQFLPIDNESVNATRQLPITFVQPSDVTCSNLSLINKSGQKMPLQGIDEINPLITITDDSVSGTSTTLENQDKQVEKVEILGKPKFIDISLDSTLGGGGGGVVKNCLETSFAQFLPFSSTAISKTLLSVGDTSITDCELTAETVNKSRAMIQKTFENTSMQQEQKPNNTSSVRISHIECKDAAPFSNCEIKGECVGLLSLNVNDVSVQDNTSTRESRLALVNLVPGSTMQNKLKLANETMDVNKSQNVKDNFDCILPELASNSAMVSNSPTGRILTATTFNSSKIHETADTNKLSQSVKNDCTVEKLAYGSAMDYVSPNSLKTADSVTSSGTHEIPNVISDSDMICTSPNSPKVREAAVTTPMTEIHDTVDTNTRFVEDDNIVAELAFHSVSQNRSKISENVTSIYSCDVYERPDVSKDVDVEEVNVASHSATVCATPNSSKRYANDEYSSYERPDVHKSSYSIKDDLVSESGTVSTSPKIGKAVVAISMSEIPDIVDSDTRFVDEDDTAAEHCESQNCSKISENAMSTYHCEVYEPDINEGVDFEEAIVASHLAIVRTTPNSSKIVKIDTTTFGNSHEKTEVYKSHSVKHDLVSEPDMVCTSPKTSKPVLGITMSEIPDIIDTNSDIVEDDNTVAELASHCESQNRSKISKNVTSTFTNNYCEVYEPPDINRGKNCTEMDLTSHSATICASLSDSKIAETDGTTFANEQCNNERADMSTDVYKIQSVKDDLVLGSDLVYISPNHSKIGEAIVTVSVADKCSSEVDTNTHFDKSHIEAELPSHCESPNRSKISENVKSPLANNNVYGCEVYEGADINRDNNCTEVSHSENSNSPKIAEIDSVTLANNEYSYERADCYKSQHVQANRPEPRRLSDLDTVCTSQNSMRTTSKNDGYHSHVHEIPERIDDKNQSIVPNILCNDSKTIMKENEVHEISKKEENINMYVIKIDRTADSNTTADVHETSKRNNETIENQPLNSSFLNPNISRRSAFIKQTEVVKSSIVETKTTNDPDFMINVTCNKKEENSRLDFDASTVLPQTYYSSESNKSMQITPEMNSISKHNKQAESNSNKKADNLNVPDVPYDIADAKINPSIDHHKIELQSNLSTIKQDVGASKVQADEQIKTSFVQFLNSNTASKIATDELRSQNNESCTTDLQLSTSPDKSVQAQSNSSNCSFSNESDTQLQDYSEMSHPTKIGGDDFTQFILRNRINFSGIEPLLDLTVNSVRDAQSKTLHDTNCNLNTSPSNNNDNNLPPVVDVPRTSLAPSRVDEFAHLSIQLDSTTSAVPKDGDARDLCFDFTKKNETPWQNYEPGCLTKTNLHTAKNEFITPKNDRPLKDSSTHFNLRTELVLETSNEHMNFDALLKTPLIDPQTVYNVAFSSDSVLKDKQLVANITLSSSNRIKTNTLMEIGSPVKIQTMLSTNTKTNESIRNKTYDVVQSCSDSILRDKTQTCIQTPFCKNNTTTDYRSTQETIRNQTYDVNCDKTLAPVRNQTYTKENGDKTTVQMTSNNRTYDVKSCNDSVFKNKTGVESPVKNRTYTKHSTMIIDNQNTEHMDVDKNPGHNKTTKMDIDDYEFNLSNLPTHTDLSIWNKDHTKLNETAATANYSAYDFVSMASSFNIANETADIKPKPKICLNTPKRSMTPFHMNFMPTTPGIDDTQHLINLNLDKEKFCEGNSKSDFSKIIAGENPLCMSKRFMQLADFSSSAFPTSLENSREHCTIGDKQLQDDIRQLTSLYTSGEHTNNISEESIELCASINETFTPIATATQCALSTATSMGNTCESSSDDIVTDSISDKLDSFEEYIKWSNAKMVSSCTRIKHLQNEMLKITKRKIRMAETRLAETRFSDTPSCSSDLSLDSTLENIIENEPVQVDMSFNIEPERIVTVQEKIEEKCKSTKHCSILSLQANQVQISTLYKTIHISISFNEETGIVSTIEKTYKMSDASHSHAFYTLRVFKEALTSTAIESTLGVCYNVISFIDYILDNMKLIITMLKEFDKLEDQFVFKLDKSLHCATFQVYNFQKLIIWNVALNISDLNNISVSVNAQMGSVNEAEIKNMARHCSKGHRFFSEFMHKVYCYSKTYLQ